MSDKSIGAVAALSIVAIGTAVVYGWRSLVNRKHKKQIKEANRPPGEHAHA